MDTPTTAPPWKSQLWGVVFALLGVALLTGVRQLLNPVLGEWAAFAFYFPWVIVAAWLWGLRVGLVACVASLYLGYLFFVAKPDSFAPGHNDTQELLAVLANACSMVICAAVGARGRHARHNEVLALARVRESEARFRAAFEHAPVGVVELDLESNEILRLNLEFARILGRDPADILGKRPMDFTHPGDIAADHEAQQQALERRPIRRHKRYIRPDGSIVWVEVRANVVHEGGPPRLVGLIKDVTEEVHTQQLLRESETQAREMSDAVPALISYLDSDLRYRFINASYEEWFNVTREQVVGRTIAEVLGPEVVALLQPYLDRVLAGESVQFEVPAPYRHGPARWIHAYYEPRRDDSGKVIGFYVMVLDVSDRKATEQALAETKQRLQDAVIGSNLVAWEFEPFSRNVEWVGDPQVIFGPLSAGELNHADHFLARIAAEDRAPLEDKLTQTAAGDVGASFEQDFRVDVPGDGVRWISSRGRLTQDERSGHPRIVGILADVTERLQTAQQLRTSAAELARHKEQLEALVMERTMALERSHEQLRRSERMASLGTFAAGLGHDLHNSLLPLRVHIEELARASRELPTIADSVHAIEAIVGYLGSLSRGMRLFSRDINQDTDRADTDLTEWKTDACRFFQSSVRREIRVTCEVEHALPRVHVAPHRLSQAVLNLVTNAADAITAARGVGSSGTIHIHARRAEGDQVSIRVTDDGAGMTEHVRLRAIEPYFTTKARGQGGTGMGLAMVFGIVNTAGGSVDIQSTPGHGTSIELLLPTAAEQETPPTAAIAHVTLSNRRISAYVAVVLQALNMRAVQHAPDSSDASDLWVTDATSTPAARVKTFLDTHPGGKVVVIGGTPDHAAAGAHTAPAEAPLSGLRSTIVTVAGA
jgi:PAS domain S-box-containing protein